MKNTMSKIGYTITQSKWSLTIIVLLLLSAKMMAQIPNNGFENWTSVGNCMEPTSWYSFYSLVDSTGAYCPVTRSTDHYPASVGSYSVRIANDTAIWNSKISPDSLLGWGWLGSTAKLNDEPRFPITGHPTSLCGYYKFLPQNGDTMNISVHLYLNGSEVSYNHFMNSSTVSDWTSFNWAFSGYSNADSARITLSSANEPKKGGTGPRGNSVLYVDNLSFDALVTSISKDQTDEIPSKYQLNQNYPNPFNPATTISFSLPSKAFVSLKLFDALGREVAVLLSEELSAGKYARQWNAANMSSGIYFYRLRTGVFTETKKLVLLR